MTSEEYSIGKAQLNELETTGEELRRIIDEGLERARQMNSDNRMAMQKKRSVDLKAQLLRHELAQYEAAERARAAKEAAELAATEAQASEG